MKFLAITNENQDGLTGSFCVFICCVCVCVWGAMLDMVPCTVYMHMHA